MPHSYMIEAQGRTYCLNRHHICSIHTDTTPFPRPSMHQGNPIPGPSEQQDPLISGPSSIKDSSITRPSSGTLLQTTNSPQKDPVKQSKQSYIPTLHYPASSSHSPASNCPINNHPKSTSHIPTSQSKLLPRPSDHSNMPVPTSQNKYASTFTRSSAKNTIIIPFQDHLCLHLMKCSTS